MARLKWWEKVLLKLYKNEREGVLDGELMALCGNRENFYAFRKMMYQMGIIREATQLKNGAVCYYFDWDIARRHIATKHLFEEREGENEEGVEKND